MPKGFAQKFFPLIIITFCSCNQGFNLGEIILTADHEIVPRKFLANHYVLSSVHGNYGNKC